LNGHVLKHMDSITIRGPLSLLFSAERGQFHIAQSKESDYNSWIQETKSELRGLSPRANQEYLGWKAWPLNLTS
jgi:hypothetical protein